uniref:Uncharacterized protein n=1 Tax=Panagrolaimus sp. JU765 TaxID=591449 RepID=A0AC34RB91_9BILA
MDKAEIYFEIRQDESLRESPRVPTCMTRVGDEYEIEMFCSRPIYIDHKRKDDNQSILVFWDIFLGNANIPFYNHSFFVKPIGKPEETLFSGLLTEFRQNIILENVKETDGIKIELTKSMYNRPLRYSKSMRDKCIQGKEDLPSYGKMKIINELMGTKVSVIKPEMLEEYVKNNFA